MPGVIEAFRVQNIPERLSKTSVSLTFAILHHEGHPYHCSFCGICLQPAHLLVLNPSPARYRQRAAVRRLSVATATTFCKAQKWTTAFRVKKKKPLATWLQPVMRQQHTDSLLESHK